MLIRARRAVGDFLFAGFHFGAAVKDANGWHFDVPGSSISRMVFLTAYEGDTRPAAKAVLTVRFEDENSAVPVEAVARSASTGQVIATMSEADCTAFHLPLTVGFQPEAWVDDYAIPSGPSFAFDAAPAILAMTADELRAFSVEVYKPDGYGRDLDVLAERSGFVGRGRDQHDGPYSLDLQPMEFDLFLFATGLDKGAALTDEDIKAAWQRRQPAEPQLKAGDWVVMASNRGRQIQVGVVPIEQPLKDQGVLRFEDASGDAKLCVFEVSTWLQIQDRDLSPEQLSLLRPQAEDAVSMDF